MEKSINHFNAFISYKHAPEDNKVADAVHKGLEHFHIPGKLRKKTGIKRINRIFRDKAELPITNDLSDNISYALEHSDYLIVLCSTNTKDSAWVPREIDTFLKNHSKRDIFTVLVNGEPHDVIPEVLQYIDRVYTDENGEEKTERVPIEPLSCDYRMPLGKAKKTELPRLVSGLIGCAYDEIMHRHRQYRLRQLTAVFSIALAVVLGFAGYMFYSRSVIRENYLESLKNQSRYLAKESGSLLAKEKRITALQLALEALPKDDSDDRPITPEAVKALTDATLAYEANVGTNVHAAWNYSLPNTVTDFRLSPDGKTLVIIDKDGVIGVWNTESHERISYFDDVESRAIGIEIPDDKTLLIWTDKVMSCYDIGASDKRWEHKIEDDWLEDSDNFMASGDSIYISTRNNTYMQLDLTSGNVMNELTISPKSDKDDFGIVESKLSPDGKKIAFRGIAGRNAYASDTSRLMARNTYMYGVLDITTKTSMVSDTLQETVKNIGWADDQTILIASSKVDSTRSSTLGGTDIVSTDHTTIRCVGTDLKEKWTAVFTCNGVTINNDFVSLGKDAVAYYSGNVITVYDIRTGKEKYSNNVNSSVVDVSDTNGDGTPTYITESGKFAVPAPNVDADAVYIYSYFTDELEQVAIRDGVYVRQGESNEVIFYGLHEHDDAWTALDTNTELSSGARKSLLRDDCLMILSEEAQGLTLYLYDVKNKGERKEVKLEGTSSAKYDLLGVHGGRVYLGNNEGVAYYLLSVDTTGGEVKKEELIKNVTGVGDVCVMVGGKLIYSEWKDGGKTTVTVREVDTDTKTEVELPKDIGMIGSDLTYYESENVVYVPGEVGYRLDMGTRQATKIEVPEGWTGDSCHSNEARNGTIAVSDGKTILLSDSAGKVTATIQCPGVGPIGMTFTEEELIVLYSDGGLYRYQPDTGEFIGKNEVMVGTGEVFFEQDKENHLLYIQIDDLTDIVDLDGGLETAHVPRSLGYHRGQDIFITLSGGAKEKTKVGYYKRYTVPELIEKAHAILQDTELTEEVKSRYGIE